MTPDMLVVLAILVGAIIFFVTEWLRVDVVALGVVVLLLLTGILTTSEALSGFSTSAVLTIAALFIVGGAVLQTGLAAMLGDRILNIAGTNEVRLIVVIMLAVAVMSGFISSTGTVAVLLPAIVSLAATTGISKSKLLIPLAFGSLLGGALTLIGTPPNIIVNDLLRDQGIPLFTFFSFTPIGGLLTLIGIGFIAVIGRRLLPDRQSGTRKVQRINTPEELFDIYRLPDNLFRARVRSRSPIIGKTLAASGIGHEFDVSVLELQRPPKPREVTRIRGQRIMIQPDGPEIFHPTPETVLERDDILIVKGTGVEVSRAAAKFVLGVQAATEEDREALINREIGIAEVVIPTRSSLIDKTIVDVNFGNKYNLSVLNIERPGQEEPLDLKETRLRFGDTLLVQGEWSEIFALKDTPRDFIVIGETEWFEGGENRAKAPVALAVLVGMLGLMVSGWVSITAASMLAGLAMVLTGCLTMDEAYDAIDWKSIVLIAGMWPLSIALEKVGLVTLVADAFTSTLGDAGPLAVMGGLFLMTAVFTQVLSNTTTTVILAPIALATATTLGVQPYAFLMSVAIAASMAFASPVASPVNTLVMGPGEYRFIDYAKVGIPLILLTMVAALLVLPLLFPL